MKRHRSFLFVPATRPDRIEKAFNTSSDAVIVDLEDAVGPEDKDAARENVLRLQPSGTAFVRVNDLSSEHFSKDMLVIAKCGWVSGIVLPKVQSAIDVASAMESSSSNRDVVALVESALGIENAREIAASGATRLMLGSVDLSAELDADPSESFLAYPRSRLVMASAAAGLAPPVDGPTRSVDDEEVLRAETMAGRALGMGGKLCIHPRQLDIVNGVYRSSLDDKAWAREVLSRAEQSGGGVFSFDGEMIDAPVLARAQKILDS